MADDIKKIIKDTANETAKVVSQDLGVVVEGIQSDVKQVLEVVDTHTQQLDRLDTAMAGVQESLGQLTTDMDVVKTTLEQVNLVDMKQDIIDLKKRVDDLEGRAVK